MEIVEKSINDLKVYDKNARIHPPKQIDLLKKNIERFGFTTPILIDENNNIIAGHGRLTAIKELEWQKVPCVLISGLTEEEIKALRLADNQLAAMAEWDMSLAIGELRGLDDDLIDLTGFDRDLLIEVDEKDDVIPEDAPSRSKIGDLYELGNGHRILCGDSTKREDVEKLMNGKKADMVFIDPPYNINYKGGGKNTSNVILQDNQTDDAFDLFLTKAFEIMDSKVVKEIALASGTKGMVGGQVEDIITSVHSIQYIRLCSESYGGQAVNSEQKLKEKLEYIHVHKTAKMIEVSLKVGAILANAEPKKVKAISDYGRKIGLAFQISDDILDIIGDKKKLGKKGLNPTSQNFRIVSSKKGRYSNILKEFFCHRDFNCCRTFSGLKIEVSFQ